MTPAERLEMTIREPTGEQCSANDSLVLPDGRTAFAAWYPQMGGSVGRALIVPASVGSGEDPGRTCFDTYVWHDGEFPFGGSSPTELHHCSAAQFMRFGQLILSFIASQTPVRTTGPEVAK